MQLHLTAYRALGSLDPTKHKIFYSFGVWLLIVNTSFARTAREDETNLALYKQINPAVVTILSETNHRMLFNGGNSVTKTGSGVIIQADGTIITNEHVIRDCSEIRVLFSDRSVSSAKVLGVDPKSDLALLRVNTPEKKQYRSIQYANPNEIEVGRKVFGFGSPNSLIGSFSVGYISAVNREVEGNDNFLNKDGFQVDMTVGHGSSGGPIVDADGKLLGLTTRAILGATGSFSLPISVSTVKRIASELQRNGKVVRPDLGAEFKVLPPQFSKSLGFPISHGVVVVAVTPGGPLAIAGLRKSERQILVGFEAIPLGDLIYKIDQTDISTVRDISNVVSDRKLDDEITLYFFRNKEKKRVTVKLTNYSQNEDPATP
jgi:S1-C subfamily serine protease